MKNKFWLLSFVFCITGLLIVSSGVFPFASAITGSSISKKVVVYDAGELWDTSIIIQFGMEEQLCDIVNQKLVDDFHLENMEVKEFVNAYYLNNESEISTSLGHDMIIKIRIDERYLNNTSFQLYELNGNNVTEIDSTRNDNFLVFSDDHLSRYAVVSNVTVQDISQSILIVELLICLGLLITGMYIWDKNKKEKALLDYIIKCDKADKGLNVL